MPIQILADSCCDLTPALKSLLGLRHIPLELRPGPGQSFVDDETLDTHLLLQAMKATKEATGTAFTAATSGYSSSLNRRLPAASAARSTAATQARAKPPRIRRADHPTAFQKEAVPASSVSRRTAERGEASNSAPWGYAVCRTMLPACQTKSQNATAHRRM